MVEFCDNNESVKYFLIFLVSFLLLPLAESPVFAKVYINEFSSFSNDDWVEFYNDADSDIDLSLYRLRDSTATNKLDPSGAIPAHGYIALDWSNKLNKDGDSIKLVKKDDESVIEDEISYGTSTIPTALTASQSVGRKTDGSTEWVLFDTGTKGASNNSANNAIVPTATPTNTPAPKTPTPSRVPTPTKVPTPTRKPTASKVAPSIKSSTAVLAAKEVQASATSNKHVLSSHPYPTAKLLENKKKDIKPRKEVLSEQADKRNPLTIISIALGMICVIFCGILVYLYYKKNYIHE